MTRERWLRGQQDGEERPLDWRTLAQRYGIAADEARRLYEEAWRRARTRREPRRQGERIYLELLEAARDAASRPSPGKVTRTMRSAAERAGPPIPRSNISPRTGQRIAPGKRTLTSYLAGSKGEGQDDHKAREHELLEAMRAAFGRTAHVEGAGPENPRSGHVSEPHQEPNAPQGAESRSAEVRRTVDAAFAMAIGNLDELDARDRALLGLGATTVRWVPADEAQARDRDELGANALDTDSPGDVAPQPERDEPMPLPADTRARMERAFGQRIDDVVVRPESPEVTGDMHALAREPLRHSGEAAFTSGTRRGDHAIAHDLAHVVEPANTQQVLEQGHEQDHAAIAFETDHGLDASAHYQDGAAEEYTRANPSNARESFAPLDEPARAAHESHLDELRRLLKLADHTFDVRINEESRQRNEAQRSSGLVSDGVVHLHPERYEPRAQRGKYLLAHELVHIGQHRLGQSNGERADPRVAEREAHALATAFAQGQQLHAPAVALGTHVLAADTGSQSGDDAGRVVGSYARVVDVSPYLILRKERDPRALPHDAETARRDPLVVDLLHFNDRVMVLAAFPGNWVEVVTDDGKHGYIDRNYILANPPEPKARLYRTKPGDTALSIAMRHYDGVEWGKDSRFYVNVLVYTNRERDGGAVGLYTSDGSSNWQDAKVKQDYWIWIPEQSFADTLHGVVSSGSITHEAAEAGKSILAFTLGYHRGLFDGIKDALMDVVDLIGMVWKALESLLGGSVLEDLGELWDVITSLDAEALLDAFLSRWNHPDPWERWEFRGWIIGFAIMLIAIEVLLALATGGAGNAARWSAKAAKLGKLVDFLKGLGVVRRIQAGVRTVGKTLPDLKKLRRIGDQGTDAAEEGSDVANAARRTVDLSQAPDTANDLIKRHWKQWSEKARRQYMEALEALGKGKALVRKMSDAELDAYQKLKRGEGTIDDVFPRGAEGNKAFRIDEKYTFQKSARDTAAGYEAKIEVPLDGGLREYLLKNMVPDRVGGKMPQELKALPRFKLESDGYTILIPKASWGNFTIFMP